MPNTPTDHLFKLHREILTLRNKVSILETREDAPVPTSFPASPVVNQIVFNSNAYYYYDGTRWLSEQVLFSSHIETVAAAGGTQTIYFPRIKVTSSIYIIGMHLTTYVATTNNGANCWVLTAVAASANRGVGGTLPLLAQSTSADAANTYVQHDDSSNQYTRANIGLLGLECTKVGNPGDLSFSCSIEYRLIGT